MTPEAYIRDAQRSGSGVPLVRQREAAAAGVIAAPTPTYGMPTRHAARNVARTVTRMFKAGENDRLVSGWTGMPLTADTIVQRHWSTLVARSRERYANDDHAKGFVRLCRQNIVGPAGIMMQAQVKTARGKVDTDANDALETAWTAWGHRDNCDVTGAESWRSLQTSAVVSAAKDGEFIFRKVFGRDAGPWGFALQIIDPVRLPVDYDVQRVNGGTNFIRHGIEFTKYGRPVAYHLTTTEETESEYQYGGRKYVRIPADEIIHGFRKDMVGQKRGLPWMATTLYSMRHLGGFEEAAIINARIGASKMAFMAFKDGGGGEEYDEDNPPEIEIEPGTMGILPSGASIEKFDPQFPSADFAPFTKYMLRKMAAGLGVPYNEFAADLEGVNFSSIRQGTLDSREHWKELQEWLIEQLVQPVFEAWLSYSLLSGRIAGLNPANLARYSAVSWQPRRWEWIDPSADSDAAVKSKNNLLKSASTIMREQGRDPGAVRAEIAADMRAQVEALVAEGFDKEKAQEFVLLSMGMQPKPPAPAAKPQPKATE